MQSSELPYRMDGMVTFLNSSATNAAEARQRAEAVRETFKISDLAAHRGMVREVPAPDHIAQYVYGNTLVYSGGGDGTVNLTIAAILGHVRDNPKASARNLPAHEHCARRVLYVAGADGNANNFALSGLGKYAKWPQDLEQATDLETGFHRPLLYTIRDEYDTVTHTGIATSCFGIGASAVASAGLEMAKPQLRELKTYRRIGRETLITGGSLWRAAPFSAHATVKESTGTGYETFTDVAGLDFIGSRIYAKLGRTPVNITDPYHQAVIMPYKSNRLSRTARSMALGARLLTGIYPRKPIDFNTMLLRLQVSSDQPVPFHTDGETMPDYKLYPGDILELKLARLAVPTLVRGHSGE